MDKNLLKEKCAYADKLYPAEKERYLHKCKVFINGIDPYTLKDTESEKDLNLLPPVQYPNILKYLVCGVSYYTLDQFVCFKGLEAHKQFSDGFVHDLHMLYVPETKNTVIRAKVSSDYLI